MADHEFSSQKMLTTGMALDVSQDLIPQNKFRFLQNIRVVVEGELRSRPRVVSFLSLNPALAQVPHSIKTIVDKITGQINHIVGIDSKIYTGNGNPLNLKVSGFSGDPLSIVDFRPEESTETYAYIADRNKMCKISVSDIESDIGISAPTKALSFTISKPTRKIINNIKAADVGDWNHLTGSAGVPAVDNRINDVILQILYDDAAPCFASIALNAPPPTLQTGCIVTLKGTDDVIVEEIIPASLLSGVATISSVSYDSGAVGLCTIVLSVADVSIRRNSVLLLDGSEYVRVLEVTRNINGFPSIRTSTIGTYITGNSVAGIASIRIYANVGTYVAGDTIFAEGLTTAIGASGISSITKTVNVDLTNADGKPLKNTDYLHCSLKVSNASLLSEIQIQLDCDSVNPFDNYFYYPIAPNFFTSSAAQDSSTLSTVQQTIQREELLNKFINVSDSPTFDGGYRYAYDLQPIDFVEDTAPIGQTGLGEDQWVELYIKLGDLKRVGTDPTRTKKDIKAVRLSINCTAAINIGLDSIWVGGGSDLESSRGNSELIPYNYIWRVRDPQTKAVSNWSPPLREAISISRTSISLLPVDANIDFDTDFNIDIARFGGTLKEYRIIGSIKNDGSAFIDTISDLVAAANQPAGRRLKGDQIGDEEVFDFYKPFTFLDTPKLGVCSVVGTKFTRVSGDLLNVLYPRGVQILIDGILNRFYTNPTDDSHVELEKDMGDLLNVTFEIKAPLLTGQPLPILFGPFGEGNSGLFNFGLGNNKAAGTIYWLDGNSPDTQSDINFLEITSPSEVILTGVMYDGYPFVYTNKRSFMLIPTFQNGPLGFIARENAGSRGVFSRWSICVGRDAIYYLTDNADGVVKVAGTGIPQNITDGSLYNLFPHNGVNPFPITLLTGIDSIIIQPPDFSLVNEIRLFHTRDYLFFRFIDLDGNNICLVYDERINDWISYDTYINNVVNAIYADERESASNILVGVNGGVGKYIDASTPAITVENDVKSIVIPFSNDQQNSRILKQYDEVVFDVNLELGGLDYNIFYDNGISGEPIINLPFTGQRRKIAKVINNGNGKLARNISCKTEFTLSSGVKLYEQQFYFLPRADQINDRFSDVDAAGVFGDKFWQGVIIEADTFGEDKELIFKDEDGNVRATIIINHNGKQTSSHSFDIPWISHRIIRTSSDGIEWIFYQEEYKFDVEPELGKTWETQETSLGIPGFKVIERIEIVARTTSIATLKIYYDDSIEEYELENTLGDKKKQAFFVRARKGKLLKYRIEANEEFRIYQNDLAVWIRQYNGQNFYQPIKPFGSEDARIGAQI